MHKTAKSICNCLAIAFLGLGVSGFAQALCPGDFCDNPSFGQGANTCDAGGFLITLTNFAPAPPSTSGIASYTYQVCSPPAGSCSLDSGRSCLDNNHCAMFGAGVCTRECAVASFRDLGHFNIGLPMLGAGSCLAEGTTITGSCTGGSFSVGPDPTCGGAFVAKCDNNNLSPGECYETTINIPGEENAPGLGAAFVQSKESTDCNETCFAGPSCEPCETTTPGDACLTRTLGFWGTHPHLIQSSDPRSLNLLPITVCGDSLTTTAADACSTSEALCSNALDRRQNPTYLSLAAQLAAAKLNLAATAAVSDGACSSWMYQGMNIQQWIAHCEDNFCDQNKQAISGSGCIEALDDFNNSQDTGFMQTPFPFDRPGPALVGECQLARGNGLWVGNGNCP